MLTGLHKSLKGSSLLKIPAGRSTDNCGYFAAINYTIASIPTRFSVTPTNNAIAGKKVFTPDRC